MYSKYCWSSSKDSRIVCWGWEGGGGRDYLTLPVTLLFGIPYLCLPTVPLSALLWTDWTPLTNTAWRNHDERVYNFIGSKPVSVLALAWIFAGSEVLSKASEDATCKSNDIVGLLFVMVLVLLSHLPPFSLLCSVPTCAPLPSPAPPIRSPRFSPPVPIHYFICLDVLWF